MPKPSQGARPGASKKKTKKRPEIRPESQAVAQASVSTEPVQTEAKTNGHNGAPVLQFRPGSREAAPSRHSSGRGAAARATAFQIMDYSYVYTDLRIIGALVAVLLVGLVALTFVIR